MASKAELEWWNKFAEIMAEQWFLTPELNKLIRAEYTQDYEKYLFRENGAFLEIGCGTGWIGQKFAKRGMRVDGLDFSDSQLDIARQLASEQNLDEVAYFTRDLVNDSLMGRFDKYDGILVNAVLHHLSDNEATGLISRLSLLLAPGGRIYLYEPFISKRKNIIQSLFFLPFSFTMRVLLFSIHRLAILFNLFKPKFKEAIQNGYTGVSPDEKPIQIERLRAALITNKLEIYEEHPFHCYGLAVAMSVVRLNPKIAYLLTPLVNFSHKFDRLMFAIIGWQNFGGKLSVLCAIKAIKSPE